MAVQRISSFLKSYAEMRKGEQFVMGEVRARARERIRWSVGLGLLAVALLFAPLPWRRLWARLPRQARVVGRDKRTCHFNHYPNLGLY